MPHAEVSQTLGGPPPYPLDVKKIAIIALTLLGLALATAGATEAASMVTSRQIKNGTIQAVDLNTDLRAQMSSSTKIIQASASTPSSCSSGCTKYVELTCPQGYRVTGGGMRLPESGGYAWVQSYPTDERTWRVEATSGDRPGWPYYPDRYAVCARL